MNYDISSLLLFSVLFYFEKMLVATHWIDFIIHQCIETYDQKNTGLVSVKCVTTGSQYLYDCVDRDFRILLFAYN